MKLIQLFRGAETLRVWILSGGLLAHYELAESRRQVCLGCAFNRKGGFWDWLGRVATWKIRLPSQRNVSGLKSCLVCHCALRVKVQMPLTNLLLHTPTEEINRLPDFCWFKKEISE
jgi:hypothetical protein